MNAVFTRLFDGITLRSHYRKEYDEKFAAAVKEYLTKENLKVTQAENVLLNNCSVTEPQVFFTKRAVITNNVISALSLKVHPDFDSSQLGEVESDNETK